MCWSEVREQGGCGGGVTFLVFWQAEEDIPTGDEDHLICEVFSLDFAFLHDYNVRLKDVEHCLGRRSGRDASEDGGVGPGMFASPAMVGIRMGF